MAGLAAWKIDGEQVAMFHRSGEYARECGEQALFREENAGVPSLGDGGGWRQRALDVCDETPKTIRRRRDGGVEYVSLRGRVALVRSSIDPDRARLPSRDACIRPVY